MLFFNTPYNRRSKIYRRLRHVDGTANFKYFNLTTRGCEYNCRSDATRTVREKEREIFRGGTDGGVVMKASIGNGAALLICCKKCDNVKCNKHVGVLAHPPSLVLQSIHEAACRRIVYHANPFVIDGENEMSLTINSK